MLWLAKESVISHEQSSADWMLERIGNLSIGMGRRQSMTINKNFFEDFLFLFELFVKVVRQYVIRKQKNLENVFFRTFWTLLKLKKEVKTKT